MVQHEKSEGERNDAPQAIPAGIHEQAKVSTFPGIGSGGMQGRTSPRLPHSARVLFFEIVLFSHLWATRSAVPRVRGSPFL